MFDQYEFSSYQFHVFYGQDGPILALTHYNGTWYQSRELMDLAELVKQPTLTQEEAQALIDQYPILDLPWQSIRTYTLADGRVIADLMAEHEAELEARPPLTGTALRQAYAEKVRDYDIFHYYAIRDINGDGVEDLLVSREEDCFAEACSTAHGEVYWMDLGGVGNSYLCEGNIVEIVIVTGMETGVELEMHAFYRLSADREPELLDYTFYNKATASWQSDLDGTPMEEADARVILNRYARIPTELRPIAELTGA